MAEPAPRQRRHRLVSWTAEILVVVLLLAAALSYSFDLGTRWFGWAPNPRTQPAAVAPPEGLRLPAVRSAEQVAGPGNAGAVDPAQVASRVRPMLKRKVLGGHYAVLVTDLATGEQVFRAGAPTVTPASTAKLLTGVAALSSLGPMARFRTTVTWDAVGKRLVLVGGGDPFLASTPRAANGSYPHRADITTLATQAARRLETLGVGRVRLVYDDSHFSGPAVNPAWPASYRPDVVVVVVGVGGDGKEDLNPS